MSNNSDLQPHLQCVYSWKVAFAYIFNLIFAAGALALPKAFAQTGIILGLITLGMLVLMSYCTSTFIVEAMAITNAIFRYNYIERIARSSAYGESYTYQLSDDDGGIYGEHRIAATDEYTPLINNTKFSYSLIESGENSMTYDEAYIFDSKRNDDDTEEDSRNISTDNERSVNNVHQIRDLYEITTKVEYGEMAKTMFNKYGVTCVYLSLSLYLYGSLSVYASGVSKCVTTVICGDTDIFEGNVYLPCRRVKKLSIIEMYRCMLSVFTIVLGPFVFLNISKTKFLQVVTTIFRLLSFTVMVVLSVIKIINGERHQSPKSFDINGLSNLFGICCASLMVQNSLPTILTPVNKKRNLKLVMLLDFVAVLLCNALIGLTAVYAFGEDNIQDVYTLNFSNPTIIKYALQLFPVFTLSTNFPILGITLRENLKTLFLRNNIEEQNSDIFIRKCIFPLITVIPPIIISYNVYDVGLLISITGAYPGAILQYMIPAMLVYLGRIRMKTLLATHVNKYRSPFAHNFWVIIIIIWYIISTVFVTINFIL